MTIEIADRLIKLRKKHGYSQEELADKLGLSRQAVSKWERAEASPDTDNLICLAKLYDVSLDELLSTDEDVETIVKEQVKEEKKPEEGIHISDSDGSSVTINKEGVTCVDEKGETVKIGKHFKRDKGSLIIDAIEGVLLFFALAAYFLLGALLGMWASAWVFFFVPGILCSIARCIYKKNANKFNMAFTACFVFFFVCMFYPGLSASLWHPMWVVFLAIPAYHITMGSINKALGKEDDEDEKEVEEPEVDD